MDSMPEPLQAPLAVRVGDEERNACVMSLIGHHLHGRLTSEDLERRQRLAMAAVDADDLRLLLMDLPEQAASLASSRRSVTVPLPQGLPWALLPLGAVLGAAGVGTAAWQYSAEGHYYTAALAGAVGYAAHAVSARVRRETGR